MDTLEGMACMVNPPALFLIFNHRFTAAQQTDARGTLGVERTIGLPAALQQLWSHVPPDLPALAEYLQPIGEWLRSQSRKGDFVLIQGDFGACYLLVDMALDLGLVPIYATTRREAREEHQADGSVKMTHHFVHQHFRKYGV